MNWDRLKLPNGWIAIWAGVVLVWATGWVVTGTAGWALDVLDALLPSVRVDW